MAALHSATDHGSNTSTPRSYREDAAAMQAQPSSVRLMCSFAGKILPRPFDNQLRYVGGDTRIVAVDRRATFSSLVAKLSKLSGLGNMCLKYQLPNEDLDALITVTCDEDVENMMEEYDRLVHAARNNKSARLRLFLFPSEGPASILDGSAKSEQWFIDALNCEPVLESGRSEVSSVISDAPDYFFDNLDERPREFRLKNKKLLHDNVSNSDPGSPAPVLMPDLPPVKTKPDKPVAVVESKETPTAGYPGSPFSQYTRPRVQPVPVYYVTAAGPIQPGNPNLPVHPMPIGAPYVQQQFTVRQGQVPVGFSHPGSNIAQFQDGQAKALDNHEMSQMYGRPVLERKVVRNSKAS